MRCEDCLPLLEEYFDGEVTTQTGEQIGAHLSACADCAAALDALSFEQEIYARYDRGGLAVTPDLWARVSAEIARTPLPESPAADRPFLSRVRASAAAALGALAVRPALAASLALLVVAAGAGTLWLSRRTQTNVQPQLAVTAPRAIQTASPAVGLKGDGDTIPAAVPSSAAPGETTTVPAGSTHDIPRESETAQNVNAGQRDGGADLSLEQLLADSPAAKDDPNLVRFRPENHDGVDDTARLLVNASTPDRDVITADAQLFDPVEKEVARHVERAQMLLRSIKNVSAGDAGDADIAYEKNLSRRLLAENSTLQLEAEVKGDKETKQVLDQIEPFLLEIANMGEKPSREEVRSIGERVRKNEIVAALEVY